MRTEQEIKNKLTDIANSLQKLEKKWFKTTKDKIQIEFHKNNICFILWALEMPSGEYNYIDIVSENNGQLSIGLDSLPSK